MSEDLHIKFAEDIGEIKGLLQGVDKKLTDQNGDIAALKKATARHDVVLGKLGLVFTGVVFFLVKTFDAIADWIKGKLS